MTVRYEYEELSNHEDYYRVCVFSSIYLKITNHKKLKMPT